jgi:hypothetical protein
MQSPSALADFGRQLPLARLPHERWLRRGYFFPGTLWNNAVADPDLADFAAAAAGGLVLRRTSTCSPRGLIARQDSFGPQALATA